MGRAATLTLLCHLCWAPSAWGDDPWARRAVALQARASADHQRWRWVQHSPPREPGEQRCFDGMAAEAEALARALAEEEGSGDPDPQALDDAESRLHILEGQAEVDCSGGERSPVPRFRERMGSPMERDRPILRLGIRLEHAPRVIGARYEMAPLAMARCALGYYVREWLRVEVTLGGGWSQRWGPAGSLGARAIATTRASRVRVGIGFAGSVVLAADRIGGTDFSWLGFQLELPVEVSLDLTRRLGVMLTGGPIFTQAGQVQVSSRAVSLTMGASLQVVL